MAAAPHGNFKVVRLGELQGRDHVGTTGTTRHDRGPLRDRGVPDRDGFVIAGFTGSRDSSSDCGTKRCEVFEGEFSHEILFWFVRWRRL
jgi:hypothetical protein